MLPTDSQDGPQTDFKWVYEEIYGADFSTLTKSMEEGTFLTLFPHYFLITLYVTMLEKSCEFFPFRYDCQ